MKNKYIKKQEPFFFFADYDWKVVSKVKSEDQRTHDSDKLTEDDKCRILTALLGEGNPRCLKHLLLNSKNQAVAKLKPQNAEFLPDDTLRLTLMMEKRNTALIRQDDVETCVYQCLKDNSCWDILLCTKKGYAKL